MIVVIGYIFGERAFGPIDSPYEVVVLGRALRAYLLLDGELLSSPL